MKEKLKNLLRSKRGSSIIMALVTITVLVLLGAAVATLSMGTLRANVADATNNDAYYAAESGVNNALDQLKLEVSRYYTAMLAVASDSGQYTPLYNNFGNGIVDNANGGSFVDPVIIGGTTDTEFSVADPQNNVYEFLAVTTSTMTDGTKYQVEGRLKVKRVDVSAKKSWFIEDAALVVGKKLTINSGMGLGVSGGKVYLGSLDNRGTLTSTPPIPITDPVNDALTYLSFSDPVITNPTHFYPSSTTIYRKTDPSNLFILSPGFSIDTSNNVNLTFAYNDTIPNGIIRAWGDLAMNTSVTINSDLYCRNFSNTGSNIYGDIYAHGNVTKTGGNIYGNIYCDGNLTLSNLSVNGSTIICGGNITILEGTVNNSNMFAGGMINLNANTTGDVIYAKQKITISAHISAIVFSGTDIEFGGGGYTVSGAVIAKNNLTDKSWWNINYKATEVAKKYDNLKGTFFRSDSGGGSATLDGSIFQSQSITAKGRVN